MFRSARERVLALFPGLVVVGVIAASARAIADTLPFSVSEVTIGILLGLLLATLVARRPSTKPGSKFSQTTLLRAGIVLLGVRLSFGDVLSIGGRTLVVILIGLVAVLCFTLGIGRVLRLPTKLCVLISVGVAICGNSAIFATAPVIDARERDVSFSVGLITFFGTLAVILYPLAGHALDVSEQLFGYWAGMAVSDTAQVVATGFAYSESSGDLATIVKLTRNTLMGPLIVVIGAMYYRSMIRQADDSATKPGRRETITKAVPLFVVGFLLMASLNSLGVIPTSVQDRIQYASQTLILMALVGVGLNTDLRDIARVGLKPFYLGLAAVLFLGGLALVLASMFLVS